MPGIPKYKAAAINCNPILGEKEKNIREQCALVIEAAKNGAKLIALPEMATTGYCWYSREEVQPHIETVPGPTTEKFAEIAKQFDCWIVVGMPEVVSTTNVYYNTAVLIGPEGLAGVHRKTHSYIAEPKWAKQGDLGHRVYETPIGNIAMLVCMDINFLETARIEALQGADVIVNISNWLGEKSPGPVWFTRAFENGCYILEANRCGLERTVQFSGGSCLIAPDGSLVASVDEGNAIVYGEIDLEKARRKDFQGKGSKFLERYPNEYMTLLHNSYLWNPQDFFGLYGYDPLPPGKKSKIAVVQFSPKKESGTNLAFIEKEVASQAGMELIVFPELSLTGFPNPGDAKKMAEPIPGPSSDRLLDICMKYQVYMIIGMIEKEDSTFYNTAVLYGPEGIVGRYRKNHLSEIDKGWAQPGNLGFPHFNTPVGRIGILIGHDAMFPEPGRVLALDGVDIICCPSAVTLPVPSAFRASEVWHNYPEPRGYTNIQWHLWRVRAGENNCYLAFANAIGSLPNDSLLIGRSGIFGPNVYLFPRNEVILSADREDRCQLTIDTTNEGETAYPTNIVRKKDFVSMRQPLLYDVLVKDNPLIADMLRQKIKID
jgi:predicted amidohydrolase